METDENKDMHDDMDEEDRKPSASAERVEGDMDEEDRKPSALAERVEGDRKQSPLSERVEVDRKPSVSEKMIEILSDDASDEESECSLGLEFPPPNPQFVLRKKRCRRPGEDREYDLWYELEGMPDDRNVTYMDVQCGRDSYHGMNIRKGECRLDAWSGNIGFFFHFDFSHLPWIMKAPMKYNSSLRKNQPVYNSEYGKHQAEERLFLTFYNLSGKKFPRNHKLMMVRILGDGNCGFYCVLTFLYAVGILEEPSSTIAEEEHFIYVIQLRKLLALYARVYEEEFTTRQDVLDSFFPGGSFEELKEMYSENAFNIYNANYEYDEYDLRGLSEEQWDRGPFFDATLTGMVVAKFFRIKFMCATRSQIRIYDGTDPNVPLGISVIESNTFTHQKVDYKMLFMACNETHCNIMFLQNHVREAQQYKIRVT